MHVITTIAIVNAEHNAGIFLIFATKLFVSHELSKYNQRNPGIFQRILQVR